jgi:hypothetical protein
LLGREEVELEEGSVVEFVEASGEEDIEDCDKR